MEKKLIEIVYNNIPTELHGMKKIDEIKLTDELFQDLGYDSISFMGLLLEIEDEWNISIIEGENNYIFFSVSSIQDLLDVLNQLI